MTISQWRWTRKQRRTVDYAKEETPYRSRGSFCDDITHMSSRAIDSFIDFRDFLHPIMSLLMGHIEDVISRPVKMVSNEGYLLVYIFQGVAYNSPRRPNSFSKFAPHSGHFTEIMTSSSLMRLYISSRKRRSEANKFSMTPVFTSLRLPS